MLHEARQQGKKFVTIVWGNLRMKVEEGAPGAVKREYETSTWASWVKFEQIFESISGPITWVEFMDSDFGKNCHIHIGEEVVSLGTDSRYFSSFAKVARNIDLTKNVVMKPYDFEDGEKRITGLSITQEGNKIANFYWDGKKATNKIPEMKEVKPDSDDWKAFFIKQKKFFIKELEAHFEWMKELTEANKPATIDDIPFED